MNIALSQRATLALSWLAVAFTTPACSSLELGSTTPALASRPEHVPGEVIVKFHPNVGAATRADIHARLDTRVVKTIPRTGAQLVRGTHGQSAEELLRVFQKRPEVKYAELNFIQRIALTPNDPLFPKTYGMENTGQTGGTPDADIDAPEAWARQTGSSSIVVADIDTGVDYTHEDLAANAWTNAGEIPGNGLDDDGNGYVDDYYGWDFFNSDNDPMDDHSHGTHTSGTMAAVGNNGKGVAGVSWNARVMALKFLGADGAGTTTGAAEAIIYAADMGARISSNSWGSSAYSQTIEDAIAYAGTKGMLFVAAAGNNASDNDKFYFYPCNSTLPNVVCVASTDHDDALSLSFGGVGSNYGFTTVDLGAPGAEILSTVPVGSSYDDNDGVPNNGYGYSSGTSMATPHVSGAAALLLAEYPQLSASQLRQILLGSVDPLPSLAGITVSGGRLNVDSALSAHFLVTGSPGRQAVWMGQSTSYTVSVSSLHGFSAPVTLSLVSPDPTITGSFDLTTVTPPADGAAGATLTVHTTSTTPRGSHPLRLVGTDALGETRTATIMLDVSGPDFEISLTPNSGYVSAGGTLTATVSLTGFDGYSGIIDLSLVSDDPAITGTFEPAAVTVPTDGTVTATLTLTTTAAAIVGEHLLEVKGYDGTRTHSASFTLWINAVDLTVTQLSISPTTIPIGSYFSISSTITNQGSEDASSAFFVWFFLSRDGTMEGVVETLSCQPYLTGLPGGTSTTVNCNVKMPTTLSSGPYYVVAYADYGNRQPEANENNNTAASLVEVAPANVDLVVTAVSALPAAAPVGSQITVTSTVTNQGTTPTYATITVGLYLSTDTAITTTDIFLGNRYIYVLEGGASSTADTVVTIPSSTAPGGYYIGAIADRYSSQPESDENNNTLAGNAVEVLTNVLWADGFESGNFTVGGWTPLDRDATVSTSAAYTGTYGASLKQTTSIEKVFSTQGYTGITVKYRRQTSGLDNGENLYVEWYDGSAWQPLETIQSASYADGLQVKSCGVGADNNPAFRLRFRIDADRTTESASIDDVEITGNVM